jgi:transglutaminase-like putative cysteine protease
MPIPPIIAPGTITPFLACSPLIACTHPAVRVRARELVHDAENEEEQIRRLYTFVRDTIIHSADTDQSRLIWKAPQVLSAGHALCFGKSHLFVALCRAVGIPAGLCYQRLKKESGGYVLHGLAAVWIEEEERWIRVDPRGNKPGINAQFDPAGDEKIAYPVMDDPGEWLDPNIYPEPWDSIVRLYENTQDVAAFIDASSQIHAPPRHPHRTSSPALVPV